ncbi:MAG: hypothetical protein NVSMB64_04820 [Candidatus Velthaea sp.]
MDYSIVIPVFNREDLTRQCLATLPPTLTGAGEGEVIVVDNGSTPATAAVLAEFPWVRVIRNDRNLGFAAACNQGARAATGRIIVHLNNDTQAFAGWLERLLEHFADARVGIAGARLLFPNDTIQHAGVIVGPSRFGAEGFGPYHFAAGAPGAHPQVMKPTDFAAVTGACLATPRELFLELGGFDEVYWNGYEDVDYCFKVGARGLRIVYEPRSVLYHFESQSGIQRKRRLLHNVRELSERWRDRIRPDHNVYNSRTGFVRREVFSDRSFTYTNQPLPPTTVIVHGPAPADPAGFKERLTGTALAPARIVWSAAGTAPPGTVSDPDAVGAARRETEARGDRYVAFVHTSAKLGPAWHEELIDTVEYARDVVAATVVPTGERSEWAPLAADAQCTLVALANLPQHVRLTGEFDSLDGAVAAWTGRAVQLGRAVRAVPRDAARVDAPPPDRLFEERFGRSIRAYTAADPMRLEELSRPLKPRSVLTSIVMLSWNAPEYTEIAVRSIRQHTPLDHEIIIIDNGSGPDTLARINAIDGVRTIYNARNMGFAYGCNQGIAAARGEFVVLLNNDVIVTDGWLESLLDAHRRDPAIGVSAPRSNFVAGHQQVYDAKYDGEDGIHRYARERSERMRGRRYHTDRVIGFCMCLSREVIAEVGGIDTRYGSGNFEDDDYCLRVRAAGYDIVVCEDSFIHHFGNASFKANKLDYAASLQNNWSIFAERWGLPAQYPVTGYQSWSAIARGYVRERDFVALPAVGDGPAERAADEAPRSYDVVLLAIVANESDWSRLAPVIGNYARAIDAADPVVMAIGATGVLDARTLALRVQKAVTKAGRTAESSPDIDISDVDDVDTWRERFSSARCVGVTAVDTVDNGTVLSERSPSGIARALKPAAV